MENIDCLANLQEGKKIGPMPVSLTYTIGKMMEIIIKEQMMTYLETKKSDSKGAKRVQKSTFTPDKLNQISEQDDKVNG